MKPESLIGWTIVAIGIVLAGLVFAVVSSLLAGPDPGTEMQLARLQAELADARAEIEVLRADLDRAGDEGERLKDELAAAQAAAQAAAEQAAQHAAAGGPVEQVIVDGLLLDEVAEGAIAPTPELTEVMEIAKGRFNQGITQPRSSMMLELLGHPRDNYGTDCRPMTSPRLVPALETRTIGNVKVTMLKPALDSFQRVMDRLRETDPDIHDKLGTAGALCARFIRGSNTAVSNHSWGTAIDLTLEGVLDGFGDGGTQSGLVIIALYFNDEGWYWGAGFGREDSMHFEAGEELIRKWVAEGLL
jgi:hypothetical protein